MSGESELIVPRWTSLRLAVAGFGRGDAPWLGRWFELISKFVVGQSAANVLNLLVGFFLLRWLVPGDFAQLSFTLGFQATSGMLIDLGAAGAIVSLVGDRTSDRQVVGAYLKAARTIRNWMSMAVLPFGAIVFLYVGRKHGWSDLSQGVLYGSLVVAIFLQSNVSIFSAPLLMHRRLDALYKTATVVAAWRLGLLAMLHVVSALSGWLAAWVNVLGQGFTARAYRRSSGGYVEEPAETPVAARREMLRYLAPLAPGLVFIAFQGQLTVFLITLFGRSQNIAEVAALGRLAQVFALLSAFNGVILQPYMAALPRSLLRRRYALMISLAAVVAGAICATSWIFPRQLLWALGGNYAHLTIEVRWMLIAASLHYLSAVMWAIHSARRWVFWWGTALYIGAMVAVQAGFIASHDLSTTESVLVLSVWSAVAALGVSLCTAIYGLFFSTNSSVHPPLRSPA